MATETDLYPSTRVGKRVAYQNVDAKIDGNTAKYSLT